MIQRAALSVLAVSCLAFGFSAAPARAADYTFTWGLPTPQGNALGGADFENVTTGYAVGPRGTVLATEDGGVSWTPRELFPAFSPDLEDVLVIGPGELIAVGSSPGVYRSTDAGVSWTAVANPSFAKLIDIERVSGAVLSAIGAEGQVLRSDNNGATWTLLASPGVNELHEQYWIDAAHGYVVGLFLTRRTTDGGQTWLPLTGLSSNDNFNEVFFTDANNGRILSDFEIWRTTNGGATWASQFVNPVVYMGNVVVLGPTHFMVATNLEGAAIFETTNDGEDWEVRLWAGGGGFFDFDRLADGSLIAVSDEGDVYRSTDSGASWTNATYTASDPQRGVIGAIGIGPGGRGAAGTTGVPPTYWFRTEDAGASWLLQPGGPIISFTRDILYWNADRAVAAGAVGQMWRTTNGGFDWTAVALPNSPANGRGSHLSLPAPGVGFVAVTGQSQSLIYRTTDFGATWAPRSTGIPAAIGLSSVSFLNANVGFAAGNAGQAACMFKTTDGGGSWTSVGTTGLPSFMSDMHWTDEQTGFVTIYLTPGGIFRTTNGGTSWHNVWSDPTFEIAFSNPLHGGAIPDRFGIDGTVAVTEDGGATWESVTLPATLAGTSISAVADGFWVGGRSNIIMKMTRVGAAAADDDPATAVSAGTLRVQGSPGQHFHVAYTLSDVDEHSAVDLAVFDAQGRRVATLDQQRDGGSALTATWDGRTASGRPASQGVYFVRLSTHRAAHAGKIVLSR